jgi:hypothetical protein
MSKNICFYSNRCKLCEALLGELAQTPYKNEFNYICVDPSPNRPRLPGFLKKVPTFVIQGEEEPLVGNEAMNWLWVRRMQDPKASSNNSIVNPGSNSLNDAQLGAGGAGGDMGLGFWNPLEMGSAGDSYSFLDQDTSVEGNGGYKMSQNFEFIGEATPNMGGGGGSNMNYGERATMGVMPIKKSAKELQFDNEMERYKQMRNMGVPQQIKRM